MVSLVASVIAGVALVATVSTDALAKKKAAPAAAVVVAPAPVAVAVIGNYGPIADRVPRCFDSPILYPVPPCY